MSGSKPLPAAGKRILIVEDDYYIAQDMGEGMRSLGAAVVGPLRDVEDALKTIGLEARLDGAVIDLNLAGVAAFPVADALIARGVPLVFASGYDRANMPPEYRLIPCIVKPVDPKRIISALFGIRI